MSARAYPRAYLRPPPSRPNRVAEAETRRSHAAIPVVVALVAVGLYFGQYSVLLPAVLGLILLVTGASFLSTRLNPLSPHFYQTRKPSWLAIGVVFLGVLALFYGAYELFVHQIGPLVPRL